MEKYRGRVEYMVKVCGGSVCDRRAEFERTLVKRGRSIDGTVVCSMHGSGYHGVH